MSIHNIPVTIPDEQMLRLVRANLRTPRVLITDYSTQPPSSALEFVPDLTTAEQAILDDLVATATSGVNLGMTDWVKVKTEIGTLRTFLTTTSPTNAQTAAALKALIRMVLAFVRQ